MAIYTFKAPVKKRVWGGQNLKTLFNRDIPADEPIGESWEVCDRADDQSEMVERGQDSGAPLHELWTADNKETLFGTNAPNSERFPILIKLLDAQAKLSLQVHPPANLADKFNGEPKTEMWYFLETAKDAAIYVGLKKGVSKEDFAQAIEDKKVADCFHVLPTETGEVMFLPSGRVHAIGEGNVILEIQQNSDTTFRVYDWDRMGTDGKPRDLHIEESMECINFNDVEPQFTQPHGDKVVECDYFAVNRSFFEKGEAREYEVTKDSFQYLFTAQGDFKVDGELVKRGTSLFVSADHGELEVESLSDEGELVSVCWPES